MWLLLAFVAVPLIEIALFIQVGGAIGLWPTLGVVVLTAIIGTWLMRAQGQLAMNNLRRSFSQLDDPSEPLAHGAMILIAGVLLLTPGFFTDALGFALLAPPVRTQVFNWVRKRVHVTRFEMGQRPGPRDVYPDPRAGNETGSDGGEVIDGEFTEIPRGKSPNHPGSGWTRH